MEIGRAIADAKEIFYRLYRLYDYSVYKAGLVRQ